MNHSALALMSGKGQRESLDASSYSDGVAQVKEVPMKTRRWIVITVLTLALSMPASLVGAAPFASITDTPRISPDVKGTVLRQGTLANSNPGGGTLACSEVRILPSISSPVFTIGESVLPNFEFSLANPSAGVYTIHAEYSGYLASEATATVPPSRDVGTTTLCGGDVNADRVINILDIGLIIGKFGACNVKAGSSDPTACSSASIADEPRDINDDGCVDIRDLSITARNWGHTGPTLWDTTQCGP